MSLFIGLDIGGTKFMVASAGEDGNIIRRVKAPTPQSLKAGLSLLQEMIAEVSAGQAINGMGAAIGGPLDWQTGVVSPLHQPNWRDVPLKDIMERTWNCSFFVDVDTNIGALGEFQLSNQAEDPLLYLTLSTGLGGGLIVDGCIYRGHNGSHPEVGHQSISWRCAHPERIYCKCGLPDCLEALISGNAIRRVYRKKAEELSEDEWEEVAWNLGQGMRNLAAIYAPAAIVLGGGVALGKGDWLITHASIVMTDHLRLVPPPKVRLSALGYDNIILGALAVARLGLA